MRRVLTIVIVLLAAGTATAGDGKFSLSLDSFDWSPRQKARTEARRAVWTDPMGRLMHNFNQQQGWIMRGTMPGGERMSSVAVRVKAQNGLPLELIAATIQAGMDVDRQNVARLGKTKKSEYDLDLMSLEDILTEELGKQLAPK
jgi:hypothetical protein